MTEMFSKKNGLNEIRDGFFVTGVFSKKNGLNKNKDVGMKFGIEKVM